MSEQNQTQVEEKKNDALGFETNETSPEITTEDKENSGDIAEDDQEKNKEDSDRLEVKDDQSKSDREKPSPITLPTDLLNPHEADTLHAPDSPTTSLITSLRTQLTLLSDQSVLLNQKLISSISKSADLEDELHELQSTHSSLTTRAKELEKEKDRWEESMNTGLLVERSQIKDEMQKLAQGLVEEERKRGTAEEKRREVENEVDDLTAKLFDQANAMVATERMSRVEAEARLKSTEENLAAAEAAVRDMQLHLQSLPPSSAHPTTANSIPPHTSNGISSTINRKYLSSHIPYSEFLSFIQHLRSLRPIKETSKAVFPPPIITNLITQPFLNRTIIEDNDPTLRFDIAPDLSWLSRRSVTQAIYSGDLIIEPVSSSTLLSQTSSAIQDIGCSLCGKSIFGSNVPQSPSGSHFGPPPLHPQRSNNTTTASRFSLKPFFATSSTSTSGSPSAQSNNQTHVPSPSQSPIASPAIGTNGNLSSVYVFRIAKPQVQSSSSGGEKSDSKLYPLCRTGWCLERMRATCELWHFVRTGIIHVVWHGDDGTSPSASTNDNNRFSGSSTSAETKAAIPDTSSAPSEQPGSSTPVPTEATTSNAEENKVQPPPLPQRKKSSWALGFKLSDKSTGGWTRGWKSGNGGSTNSPPTSPGVGGMERSDSVGSLGAEKGNGDKTTEAGLGLGEALDIDEKKVEGEKDVPIIQEPPSAGIADPEKEKEGEDDTKERPLMTELSDHQAPPLSRAGSNISIPLSVNTDETGFHTPKGGQTDLPSSEDGHDSPNNIIGGEEGIKRDEQSTPHPPVRPHIDTEGNKDNNTIELNSPTPASASASASATASPTKQPPPIPKRAAGRNRLSQLSGGGNTPLSESPINSQPPTPSRKDSVGGKDEDDDDELSILRELRDELEQRKSEDVRGDVNDVEKDGYQDENQVKAVEGEEQRDKVVAEEQEKDKETDTAMINKDKSDNKEVEENDEPPFTPVNLDEKFPLSPLQRQSLPSASVISTSSNSGSGSRPNSITQQPPTLPPRNINPKTPILQISNSTNSHSVEGEKRYFQNSTNLNENAHVQWENKTWEKIVKLKEEMWKSRIGVLDE